MVFISVLLILIGDGVFQLDSGTIPLPASPAEHSLKVPLLATTPLVASDESETGKVDCGRRCSYFLLRLCGFQTEYSEVESQIATSAEGSSLSAVCSGLNNLGLGADCVLVPSNRLDGLPVPAIAHMERVGRWQHYVVVTKIDADGVQLFEPGREVLANWPKDRFLRLASGKYVVRRDYSRLSPIVLIVAGIGCSLLVWTFKSSLPRKVSLVAGLCLMVGCGQTPSSPVKPAVAGAPGKPSDLITLSQTSVDLGAVPAGSPAEHRFVIQSRASQELVLTYGRPSCGCVKVKFEPSHRIPAGGTATFVMQLDTDKRLEGGNRSARVTIGLDGSLESHEIELKAQVAGLAIVGSPARIVARPDGGPVEVEVVLACYSLKRDHQPYITSLRALKLLRTNSEPMAEADPKSRQVVEGSESKQPPEAVELSFGRAQASSVERIVDGLFVRNIKVPVRLTTFPDRPFEARLLVDYEMGGHPLPTISVPLMVLN